MTKDSPESDDRSFDPSQIQRNCFACGTLQIILAKILGSEGTTYVSKNRMGVCLNTACHRYLNLGMMPSWTRA